MEMMPSNPPMGDAPKHIRIPLTQLPDAKEGDTFTVAKIDTTNGMAVLMPEDSLESAAHMENPDDKEAETSPAEEEEKSEGPSMDTKTLLGPMDGLKNYLVQKSQDVPKNQGR